MSLPYYTYTIILLIVIPVIGLFFGLMTGAIASNKGRSAAWFWMGFCLDIVGLIVVICLPNLNNKKPPVTSNMHEETIQNDSEPQMDKFEEIRKYKELLDEGIITQEEFEAKKKELL